jgi:hypothetical protein
MDQDTTLMELLDSLHRIHLKPLTKIKAKSNKEKMKKRLRQVEEKPQKRNIPYKPDLKRSPDLGSWTQDQRRSKIDWGFDTDSRKSTEFQKSTLERRHPESADYLEQKAQSREGRPCDWHGGLIPRSAKPGWWLNLFPLPLLSLWVISHLKMAPRVVLISICS